MKIETTKVIKTLENKDVIFNDAPLTVGKAIAQILSTTKSEDPTKSYILAKEFYTKEEVEITPEDVVFIKEKAKSSEMYPFIVAQVIEHINK